MKTFTTNWTWTKTTKSSGRNVWRTLKLVQAACCILWGLGVLCLALAGQPINTTLMPSVGAWDDDEE